jgi:transposase-like protein
MGMTKTPNTLLEAVKFFASPDNCRNYMVALRWPNGVTCPQCGSTSVYFDTSRNGWECKTRHPKRKFTLKTGTIFEDSPLGLDKWLPCVWMIANAKNGVSSWEIHRAIGVTQKTAWFMLQRIRLAMQNDDDRKLSGEVEADETFVGGKTVNMHRKKRERVMGKSKGGQTGKTAVMGLLERHGDGKSFVRTEVLANTKKPLVEKTVRTNVEPGSTLYTDAMHSYRDLKDEYIHEFIDHAEKYAEGAVHTNGLENFWSLVKRALKGTYVAVEPFHLFRYLDEQAFRFNHRLQNDAGRFILVLMGIVGKRLTYAELIADDAGII